VSAATKPTIDRKQLLQEMQRSVAVLRELTRDDKVVTVHSRIATLLAAIVLYLEQEQEEQ
jgi:hypothetical protein